MPNESNLIAETVTIASGSDEIEAYAARVLDGAPRGGVVVIHHLPGYDRESKEHVRRFASMGWNAVAPNLYSRQAPGADPADAAAKVRADGGITDEQLVTDVAAAAAYLRELSNSNGKIGVIGHCSGGRQSFLAATALDLDAAVDCYGALVTGVVPDGFPLKARPIGDRTPQLSCPLLGLFGNDDAYPSPEHVDELEQLLKDADKTYEFHRYDGAGHSFFSVDRPAYRPEAAVDGWSHISTWFTKYLAG